MIIYIQGVNFTLVNSLFGTVKLTKNADIDKYSYSGYSIGAPLCLAKISKDFSVGN